MYTLPSVRLLVSEGCKKLQRERTFAAAEDVVLHRATEAALNDVVTLIMAGVALKNRAVRQVEIEQLVGRVADEREPRVVGHAHGRELARLTNLTVAACQCKVDRREAC